MLTLAPRVRPLGIAFHLKALLSATSAIPQQLPSPCYYFSSSSSGKGRIVIKPSQLIKTNLDQHMAYLKSQRLDPNQPPPDIADESGLVSRDLTDQMLDVKTMFDPRIHLPQAPRHWKGYEEATPLSDELMAYMAVRAQPMTVADYMRQALTHELYGYYTNPTKPEDYDDWDENGVSDEKDKSDWDNDWDLGDDDNKEQSSPTTPDQYIIGRRGDFVTAPEVSQVFGECLAIWFVIQWQILHKTTKVRFVEVGPGKGTLMRDLLSSCLQTSGLDNMGLAIQEVHFVEASPAMRQEQRRKLETLHEKVEEKVNFVFHNDIEEEKTNDSFTSQPERGSRVIHVHWHANFANFVAEQSEKEKMATFCICQEFIDALPVHVFEKTADGWRERMVDVAVQDVDEENKNTTEQKEIKEKSQAEADIALKTRFRVVLSPGLSPACRTLLNVDENGNLEGDESPVGQVCEVCPEGILLVQDIARFLEQHGGAALIVDYGQEGSMDSLRGFSRHKQVNFLSRPGQVDVTADVNFGALRHAVNALNQKVMAFGPVTQGRFLASMGIVERVTALIEDDNTSEEQGEDLYHALERLVLPEQMGDRYKVLAIAPKKDGIFEPPGF
jgi:NADH dehydrogenase [ubiquinone] 1 alpha subcomplex assembly factor 7